MRRAGLQEGKKREKVVQWIWRADAVAFGSVETAKARQPHSTEDRMTVEEWRKQIKKRAAIEEERKSEAIRIRQAAREIGAEARAAKKRSYEAAYRAAHQEKIRARKAAYRAANPEKVRASKAAYRAANPEKIRAIKAAYRAANREKERVYQAKYRAAHREKARSSAAAWDRTHPAECAAKNAKKRARKRAATIGDPKAIAAVYRRAREAKNVNCYLCGKLIPLGERHVDHVWPLAKNGPHTASNLAIACAKCNLSKSARLPEELGLLL
jgi:5-methylcytosine-specific restriction endonuclease McrA